jgi:hypothetical protein
MALRRNTPLLCSSTPFRPVAVSATACKSAVALHDGRRRVIRVRNQRPSQRPYSRGSSHPVQRDSPAGADDDLKDDASDEPPDQFVADPDVAVELGVSLMTIWRYDQSPELEALGWPAKIKINKRNFRSRRQLENFKANILRRAMAERKRLPTSGAA